MAYKQLSLQERYRIAALLQTDHSAEAIGRALNRSGNTIRTELSHSKSKPYCAEQSHLQARIRKPKNAFQLHEPVWNNEVWPLLEQDWSPEQIAGHLRTQGKTSVSHMSIYRRLAQDKRSGGKRHLHLRCRKPYRKRHTKEKRGQISNRRDITERPEIVEQRARVGDWELDLVMGAEHRGAMITILERRSGLYLSKWIPNKSAEGVAIGVIQLLLPLKAFVQTITSDNGLEFAQHEWIAQELGADFYFAKPYASWQRGSNENANGLLRQYFPKGMAFEESCKYDVVTAVWKMNSRPRKRHNYKTPIEIFAAETGMKYINAAMNTIH